jgi:hypothetical protein
MCTFTIPFTGTADDFIARIKAKVAGAGGTFDPAAATFSVPIPGGAVDGNYAIAGQDITINITHKPLLISCGMIQNYVENNV